MGVTVEVCVALVDNEIDGVSLYVPVGVNEVVAVPVSDTLDEGVLSAVGEGDSLMLVDIVRVDEGVKLLESEPVLVPEPVGVGVEVDVEEGVSEEVPVGDAVLVIENDDVDVVDEV